MLKIGVNFMGNRCGCGTGCGLPIVIGIIAGIVAVVFGATFTAVTTFLWIAFGVSLLTLALFIGLIFIATEERREEDMGYCICKNGVCLLIGIFGTLISSIVSLAVGTLTGTLGAILGFLVTGFLFWTIIAFLILLICVVVENCGR